MTQLHFSILIQAPKQKVWETLLNDTTYRQWTEVFSPGSHFRGDWSKGSKILFIGPNDNGREEGMVSMIAENRPYEFLSIKHVGILKDGVEDTESPEAKAWAPAYENYTLKETNGGTEFSVDMDSDKEFLSFFETTWPLALQRLKELAETGKVSAITVAATVKAPIETVWEYWTAPKHITQWAFASDDWEAPAAENDVREGGTFKTVMAAKDGRATFDFEGTYTKVKPHELLAYTMTDGRKVTVQFMVFPDDVRIAETFDMETENPEHVQREGWQAILNNFKHYTEEHAKKNR